MERNACGVDRLVRLVGGAALLALVARSSRRSDRISLRTLLTAYAGAELLATGAAQWCPANALLGRNTCAGGADGRRWTPSRLGT